jgi:hypothetical protein
MKAECKKGNNGKTTKQVILFLYRQAVDIKGLKKKQKAKNANTCEKYDFGIELQIIIERIWFVKDIQYTDITL